MIKRALIGSAALVGLAFASYKIRMWMEDAEVTVRNPFRKQKRDN